MFEPSPLGLNLEFTYQDLPSAFFTPVRPIPVSTPQRVIWNESLAKDLGLSTNPQSMELWELICSGNAVAPGSQPIAQAYAGHQFGHFTNLGDGRAVLLGEHRTPVGKLIDITLKGSGPTPYSRRGDGRAALGPMLREFLISEGMFHLGIPTTRSLAVCTTGETVFREGPQNGAVLTRIAASHIRVGTFEYASAMGDLPSLKTLADYVITRHYPECQLAPNPYQALYSAVLNAQARLVAQWLSVGFIHGVMNTDNMALSGETIDYGPCAFLDHYHPDTVFSSIDVNGRYAYSNQAPAAHWNLARLGETLIPLFHSHEDQGLEAAKKILDTFPELLAKHRLEINLAKLGLETSMPGDESLFEDLLSCMAESKADYTNTFRALSEGVPVPQTLAGQSFAIWFDRWELRLKSEPRSKGIIMDQMCRVNPAFIPRNHLVEASLLAAQQGDLEPFLALWEVLKSPFETQPQKAKYREPPRESEIVYQTFCGT